MTGIIRVALKETYTSTDEVIKARVADEEERAAAGIESIIGPDQLAPYDTAVYSLENVTTQSTWTVTAVTGSTKLITDLVSYSVDTSGNLHIEVIVGKSFKQGFDINYGNLTKHITIKSL